MPTTKQLAAEWEACARRTQRASHDWKRYKAHFGPHHRLTQAKWHTLTASWAAGDVAWRAYAERAIGRAA